MKSFITASILFSAALGLTSLANAQYVGPSDQKTPQSVAEILKNPVDDQKVILQGKIVRKVGKEKYLFSDGSAEIRVEIDDDVFPGQKIDQHTHVEIRGEVEKDFLESPEIDVDVLIVAPAK